MDVEDCDFKQFPNFQIWENNPSTSNTVTAESENPEPVDKHYLEQENYEYIF